MYLGLHFLWYMQLATMGFAALSITKGHFRTQKAPCPQLHSVKLSLKQTMRPSMERSAGVQYMLKEQLKWTNHVDFIILDYNILICTSSFSVQLKKVHRPKRPVTNTQSSTVLYT